MRFFASVCLVVPYWMVVESGHELEEAVIEFVSVITKAAKTLYPCRMTTIYEDLEKIYSTILAHIEARPSGNLVDEDNLLAGADNKHHVMSCPTMMLDHFNFLTDISKILDAVIRLTIQ